METTTLTGQLFEALMPTILAIIAILGSIATVKLNGYLDKLSAATGVTVDDKHRNGIMFGLRNAALLLIAGRAHEDGTDVPGTFERPGRDIDFMVQRVKSKYPDAVAHFNLSDDDLREMATAEVESMNLRQ